MPEATTHIVFSDTFAASLSTALRELGCDDAIACLPDDLSFGPTNPSDPATRFKWIRKELAPDLNDGSWQPNRITKFWKVAFAPAKRRIAWVSQRAASEYAGFLDFVSRSDNADCDLVAFDTDGVIRRGPNGHVTAGRAICLSELPPYHLAVARYWDRAVKLDSAARERYRANWAQLRKENAPLRILSDHGMVSAPITYFDELLVSCTIDRWRKAARVIGEALCSFTDGPFSQVGDFFSAGRLRVLVQTGRLEGRGNLTGPRFSEVRLPNR
jgi:hypothetical protein